MANLTLIKVTISSVADGTKFKTMSGEGRLEEEIVSRPLFQQTGFTSIPKSGTTAIALIDGNQVTGIASSDSLSDRPTLSNAKDVAIYADSTRYIMIEADGTITVTNGDATVKLETSGTVDINNGNLTIEA